jgi:hypothetical protein
MPGGITGQVNHEPWQPIDPAAIGLAHDRDAVPAPHTTGRTDPVSRVEYPEHGTSDVYPWNATTLAGAPELDVDESPDAAACRAEFADAYRARMRKDGRHNAGGGYLPQHMRETGVASAPQLGIR